MDRKKIIFMNKNNENNKNNVLTQLSGLSASEILRKTGQYDNIPIDIVSILSYYNINISHRDFSEIENCFDKKYIKTYGNILGAAYIYDNGLTICYRRYDTFNRIKFTLAHELAHCCLHMSPDDKMHIEFRNSNQIESGKEYEANIFAGELLIPEHSLRKIYAQLISPLSTALAQIFSVSINVMESRLKYLGLSYINSEYKRVIPDE